MEDQAVLLQSARNVVLDKDIEQAGRSEEEKVVANEKELVLERIYNKGGGGGHQFYCPNCDACITKVLLRPIDPPPPKPQCPSCFSFVTVLFENLFARPQDSIPTTSNTTNASSSAASTSINTDASTTGPTNGTVSSTTAASSSTATFVAITASASAGTAVAAARDPEPSLSPNRPRETKRLQILKSVVYGGLAESITSLGIVTSAASADASTASIVALALANLIGGLFVIGHNIWELRDDHEFTRPAPSDQIDLEDVDKYQLLLGDRNNFFLHLPIAIISFIFFGLVPPLVYGFSFMDGDDGDLKLAVVAGSSLVCITLLALGKAHIQKPSKWQEYIKTGAYYLTMGIGVSGLSYLGGDLVKKLIQTLGWFDSSSAAALNYLSGTDIRSAA